MDGMDGLDLVQGLTREAYVRKHAARCAARLRERQAGGAGRLAGAGWQRGQRASLTDNDASFLAEVLRQAGEPFTIGGAAAALGYERSSASKRILRLLARGLVVREYVVDGRKRGVWAYRAKPVEGFVTGVTANVRGAIC